MWAATPRRWQLRRFGHREWRPASAWQPIVDGTLSLLRRLLLADSWRATLLDALHAALVSVPELLREAAEQSEEYAEEHAEHGEHGGVGARAHAAVAAFSILGGHIWCPCPGARVSVSSADAQSSLGKGSSGTVLHGSCGAECPVSS